MICNYIIDQPRRTGWVFNRMKSGMARPSEFVTFAAAALRGEEAIWPSNWAREYELQFLDRARRNGIEALLYDRLHTGPEWQSWPENVRATLKTNSQLDAAVEIIRKSELERVLNELSEKGLRPLLFKGTPLAYSLYPAPHQRHRVDTDVLLPQSQINQAQDIMTSLGYEPELAIPGDTILSQMILKRTDERGLTHTFDVHWKISNPQAFVDLLTYEELVEDCGPVRQFRTQIFEPDAVHALLIACIHRAAHHLASNRLIWLYDMHLLLQSMTKDDLESFTHLAIEKGVAAVCLDALEATQRYFASPLPTGLLLSLQSAAAEEKNDARRAYVGRPRNRLHLLWRDLRSTNGFRTILRTLKQHALPPPSYMLRRYETDKKALLPFLYTRRLLEGVPKLIRRL